MKIKFNQGFKIFPTQYIDKSLFIIDEKEINLMISNRLARLRHQKQKNVL